MYNEGWAYLDNKWNYLDVQHLFFGYLNLICQSFFDPFALPIKVMMIMVVLTSLMKQFFFMRVVMSFSYIVTMIVNVVSDLRVFLLFFIIQVLHFSMIFNVIAINKADEYRKVGPMAGNFLSTIRLSLGDFDFNALEDSESEGGLNAKQHFMFWTVWVVMVLFSSLIFLNFIIAEVSSSYQGVKEKIGSLIYKERAALIEEVENLIPADMKTSNKKQFPNYIVVRELEV